jgi:hypothetical protein
MGKRKATQKPKPAAAAAVGSSSSSESDDEQQGKLTSQIASAHHEKGLQKLPVYQ